MARQVSNSFRASTQSISSDDAFLTLLEISHPEVETFYLVNNNESIAHQGNIYEAFAFELTMPADTQNEMPYAELSIDNVGLELIETVRSIATPPYITIRIIASSNPNVAEIEIPNLRLRNIAYDQYKISGRLQYDDILNAKFPKDSYTPQNTPGIF